MHCFKVDWFPKFFSYPSTSPPPLAKLDIATEVIAENLGKAWRKLGRKLGLTEVKLESISKRHPTDLEETVLELLKEWRKSRGAEARTEELIRALRACQHNLTADKVEHRLGTPKDWWRFTDKIRLRLTLEIKMKELIYRNQLTRKIYADIWIYAKNNLKSLLGWINGLHQRKRKCV